MKKRLSLVFILLIVCAIFSSCANFPMLNNNSACQTCVDINKDAKCDRCGSYVAPKAPEHTECLDANGDGKCDECGASVEKKHTECVDKDNNGKCDECGAHVEKTHTECVDKDNNGKCDECGADLEIHLECSDQNEDGKCDVCGKDLVIHTECIDKNTDGECDECGKSVDVGLDLIKDGKITFRLVCSNSLSGEVFAKIDSYVDSIIKLGYEIELVRENETFDTEKVEVLIGDIASRGEEYSLDGRIYGYKGYAVKRIDDKVILVAGSDEAIQKAVNYFFKDLLGYSAGVRRLSDVSISANREVESYQEYRITSISVGEREISDYVIAADKSDTTAWALANEASELFFLYAGYLLNVVEIDTVTDKYISIAHIARTGGEGFDVNISGQNVIITSEFDCKTAETGRYYFTKLLAGEGKIVIEKSSINTRDITYEENGAVGDGETDDYIALWATHNHANRCGHTVVASDNATYYIGPQKNFITIKMDVRWGNATFIFDDREIEPGTDAAGRNIFHFAADNAHTTTYTPENSELIRELNANGGIDAQTITKLDLGFGYAAMLEVYNANHKVYIRTHLVNEGNDQRELIIVDAEGNIDPSTPFLLNYDEVTSIVARSIETEPITIEGGNFITYAPALTQNYPNYMSRGIVIQRANVTVRNITHEVRGEGEFGCPYGGFLNFWRSVNSTVEDSSFMSHKTYSLINSNGVFTSMGTYDISMQGSNNITFKNCTQPNFFEVEGEIAYLAEERWGIMGSNYSKNIHYENCRLSRLDAHCGVYNASLKNCEVVYISVVGGGTLTIEDTVVYNDTIVSLRGDYGSTWNGDVIIKNVTLMNIESATVFSASWQNHNYGYKTYLPRNVYIDNLSIYRSNSINIFSKGIVDKGDVSVPIYLGEENVNPMTPTERIVITNNKQNVEFVFTRTPFFIDTELIFE